MDDFWKYLIVANNIAMMWMVFTAAKTNRDLGELRDFVISNSKADTELFSNSRLIIGLLKKRIEKLENLERPKDVDVKDS